VDFVRDDFERTGVGRMGSPRWRRIAEIRCRAKSVFHFDVPGSVAKSTHAGLPWLLHLRRALGPRLHFWPFDGWEIAAGRSAIAEAYPSLWKHTYPEQGRTPDQHDAYTVATWLRDADQQDHGRRLRAAMRPALSDSERAQAEVEGWIIGVA
jgi:hypothetical protein